MIPDRYPTEDKVVDAICAVVFWIALLIGLPLYVIYTVH